MTVELYVQIALNASFTNKTLQHNDQHVSAANFSGLRARNVVRNVLLHQAPDISMHRPCAPVESSLLSTQITTTAVARLMVHSGACAQLLVASSLISYQLRALARVGTCINAGKRIHLANSCASVLW